MEKTTAKRSTRSTDKSSFPFSQAGASIHSQMQLNPLTLAFKKDGENPENEFIDYYFFKSIKHVRFSLLAAIFFYGLFGVLDAILFPELKLKFWFIRFGLVCPALLAVIIFSYTAAYKRFFQLSLCILFIISSLGIIMMIIMAPPPIGYTYYAGIILIFIFAYTFVRARFISAACAGLITMILYEIAAVWISDTPLPILIQNNFFFISANFIGLFACYSMEYHERRDFFLARRLRAEQDKVISMNRTLEQRIQERTNALALINKNLEDEMAIRRLTEEALRKSEEKYRSILENIEEGYFEVNLAGDFTFLNDSMCRIIGYTKEESLGMNNRDYATPQTSREMYLEFNRVYRTGIPTKDVKFEIIKKNGTVCQVELSVALIRNAEQVPMGFRGIMRDITDKIMAENEKKELEGRIARMQKMEALGLLAGGVAHDLNNVLTGVVSYPEILLMTLPNDSPLKSPLLKIQSSGQKAAAIVEDLLALARRGVIKMEALNLNQIVTEHLNSAECAKLKADYGNVRISLDLAADLLNIQGSPVHLSKMLMNLFLNAAESQPLGGEIIITTQNRYFDSQFSGYQNIPTGNYAVLAIEDKGSGIAPEDMERIFEPFYTKKILGRSGTGLGMSVVWGTMQDHKGYIHIRSIPGKGTSFELFFPVTWEEIKKEAARPPVADYMGKGEHILIVDDIPEQREILTAMLEKLNYRITAFSSGEEVVACICKQTADLLILDMIMDPGMDGLDTYKQILKIHPHQRAVIVSGYSETGRIKEALRLGVCAHIKKPYRMDQLGLTVKEALKTS